MFTSIYIEATGHVRIELEPGQFRWLRSVGNNTQEITKCQIVGSNRIELTFVCGSKELLFPDSLYAALCNSNNTVRYVLMMRRQQSARVATSKLRPIDSIPAHCYFGAQINVLFKNDGPSCKLYGGLDDSTVFRVFEDSTGAELSLDIHYIDANNDIPNGYLMIKSAEIDYLGFCRVTFADDQTRVYELPPDTDCVECVNSPFPLMVRMSNNDVFTYGFAFDYTIIDETTLTSAFPDNGIVQTKYGRYTEIIQEDELRQHFNEDFVGKRFFNVERVLVEKSNRGDIFIHDSIVFRPTGSHTKRALLQSHL